MNPPVRVVPRRSLVLFLSFVPLIACPSSTPSVVTRPDASPDPPRDEGGPWGDVSIDGVTSTTYVGNLEITVRGFRHRFRVCYSAGLSSNPTMHGSVTIAASIAANGLVASADIESNTGLSDSVVQCLTGAVRKAQFDAPGGLGSKVRIPVRFAPHGE